VQVIRVSRRHVLVCPQPGYTIALDPYLNRDEALEGARQHLLDEIAYYRTQLDALDGGQVRVWRINGRKREELLAPEAVVPGE
jgi:hypothetical protein